MSQHTIFEYPILIREGHLDTFGHVNNAIYLSIFEEARWDLITKNNFGIDKIRQLEQGPIILEVNIRFIKELKLRMQVKIKTQLLTYERKIGVLKQWIEDDKGQIFSEAEFKTGLFDWKERKLILPTKEWLSAIGAAFSN